MKVFIYATEGLYGGLHGIEALEVMEVDNLEDAEFRGGEMADNLIYEYGLEDEYDESEIEPELNYLVYAIAPEYISMSDEELTDIAYNMGYEDFIDKYCGEELA